MAPALVFTLVLLLLFGATLWAGVDAAFQPESAWRAAGIDRLNGGTGRDTLSGGLGNDFLTGQRDRLVDQFIFDRSAGKDRITGFVLPLGYSFNLDGTSIYLTMAAMFIAQAADTPMTLVASSHAWPALGASDLCFSLNFCTRAGCFGLGLTTIQCTLERQATQNQPAPKRVIGNVDGPRAKRTGMKMLSPRRIVDQRNAIQTGIGAGPLKDAEQQGVARCELRFGLVVPYLQDMRPNFSAN